MKTKALLFAISLVFLYSCSTDKEGITEDSANFEVVIPGNIDDSGIGSDGDLYTDDLVAGQYYDSGVVNVVQLNDNLVITYATEGYWQIDATHLYIGDLADLPINGAGNPMVGNFEHQGVHPDGTTLVTDITTDNNLVVGTWAHFALVRNGNTVTLYMDGSSV